MRFRLAPCLLLLTSIPSACLMPVCDQARGDCPKAPDAGALAPDAGTADAGDSQAGTIVCNEAPCAVATHACCFDDFGVQSCVADSVTGYCPVRRKCDSAADCSNGEKCCAPITQRLYPLYGAECTADCSRHFFQLCADSSECASGTDCLSQSCRVPTDFPGGAVTVRSCGPLSPSYCW